MTDPLTLEERSALTRIRQHSDIVGVLRADIAALHGRGAAETTLLELRRVTDQADRAETLLGIPREILSREALATEWPAEELLHARKVLDAIDDCDTSLQRARLQIEDEGDVCSPVNFCDSLEGLLSAWGGVLSMQREVQEHPELVVSKVSLTMDARANLIRPLLDALIDKASEIRSGLTRKAQRGVSDEAANLALLNERLRKLFGQDHVRKMLVALQVEIPDFETPAVVRGPAEGRADGGAAPESHGSSGGGYGGAVTDFTVEDPLLHTVPNQRMAGAGAGAGAGAAAGGSAELWHAVHVGDSAAVQNFISSGTCTASMRDASGHSVFWHAVAFQHMEIATAMLDAFPPGTRGGVAVDEVHSRKCDTLLHLLCQSQRFGQETATLFKRVAGAVPVDIFQKVNANGLTFLQIAALSLNFWVLTFMFRNFQAQAKALVCMPNNAPMKHMADRISEPSPPNFVEPEPLPESFKVSEMLQQDESGAVPYADVAFDVGPDTGGVASGRFLAHRVVVSSQSPVLLETLSKASLTTLQREGTRAAIVRVDARIPKDVWRSVLQFMYTGSLPQAYKGDVQKSIDLLRACVLYRLAAPLTDFAQHCLYPLLPTAPPQVAQQVFSICSGISSQESAAAVTSAKEASAYILLRSAHRLYEGVDPAEACHTLERVVHTVERFVFSPTKQQQPPRVGGGQTPLPGGAHTPGVPTGTPNASPTPRMRNLVPAHAQLQPPAKGCMASGLQSPSPLRHGAQTPQPVAMHGHQYHQPQLSARQPMYQPPSPYPGQAGGASGVFRMQSWT